MSDNRIEDFELSCSDSIRNMIVAAKKKLKLIVPWPAGTKFQAEKRNGIVTYFARLPTGHVTRSPVPLDRMKMDSSAGTYYNPEQNAVYLVLVSSGEQLLFQFDEPVVQIDDTWKLASEAIKDLQARVKELTASIKEYVKPVIFDE